MVWISSPLSRSCKMHGSQTPWNWNCSLLREIQNHQPFSIFLLFSSLLFSSLFFSLFRFNPFRNSGWTTRGNKSSTRIRKNRVEGGKIYIYKNKIRGEVVWQQSIVGRLVYVSRIGRQAEGDTGRNIVNAVCAECQKCQSTVDYAEWGRWGWEVCGERRGRDRETWRNGIDTIRNNEFYRGESWRGERESVHIL